jgi:uncharacterized repeat protein (TIGR03803 family)
MKIRSLQLSLKRVSLLILLGHSNFAHCQFAKLFDFSCLTTTGACQPQGSLISDGTFLYGLTSQGGPYFYGVLFKIKPDGSSYSVLYNFGASSTDGKIPLGSLVSDGTFFYGTTVYGGNNGDGILFKIKPGGSAYQKLHDFDATINDGTNAHGSLIFDGTFLYGTTQYGGLNNKGTIFKITPDGTGYSKILDFDCITKGCGPLGSLLSDGTFLYGMTQHGGVNGFGTVFRVKTDGSAYSKLLDFKGTTNGATPYGDVITDGASLYGMTGYGGINDHGTIFTIKPDGSGFVKLFDFDIQANEGRPFGSLILDNGFLYGMANKGGTSDFGGLFKIKTDGTNHVKLLDFDGALRGGSPTYGALIMIGQDLLGMTETGGINGDGVIFKQNKENPTAVGIANGDMQRFIKIFPNPISSQVTIQSKDFLSDAVLRIYNSTGEEVRSIRNINGHTLTIFRDNLPKGLYFIYIIENDHLIANEKLLITD